MERGVIMPTGYNANNFAQTANELGFNLAHLSDQERADLIAAMHDVYSDVPIDQLVTNLDTAIREQRGIDEPLRSTLNPRPDIGLLRGRSFTLIRRATADELEDSGDAGWWVRVEGNPIEIAVYHDEIAEVQS